MGRAAAPSSPAQAENVYAMFNNNGRSTMPGLPTLDNPAEEGTEVAQAPVNAQMLRQLLEREGLPVTPRAGRCVASGRWSPGRTSSPAASTSTPSRARS